MNNILTKQFAVDWRKMFDDILSREEQKNLIAWYKEQNYTRFHSMNAALCNASANAQDFISYRRWISKHVLVHNTANIYFHVFYFDENATEISSTTSRQLCRWVNESLGFYPPYTAIWLYDIRNIMKSSKYELFTFQYPHHPMNRFTANVIYGGDLRDSNNAFSKLYEKLRLIS